MVIRCDGRTVHVEDVDDLGRLHVLTACDAVRTDASLRGAGLGRLLADGRAALDLRALHARVVQPHSAHWEERWAAMVAFAVGHGWVADDGDSLIAHIETD
ncbi:MAG: hypothetical protein ABS81_05965 [Pseudonocardia sp. SCN 72-86]|nr:MAG: hypothetical protein ABS81_05965 [Pseudonocardia sp. SCN 72-86]